MSEKTVYNAITTGWADSQKERLPAESVQYFKTIGSTNDVLLTLAEEYTNKTITTHLAVADFQTAGRGRRGDVWIAPVGKNLLFSVLLPLNMDRKFWTHIPQLIAWTMGRTIETVIDPGLRIEAKWPNDLYLEGKKLGGILVETSLTPNPVAIVGLGLNVNVKGSEFPPEISNIATTLYDHVGCESNRWYLLGQFLATLLEEFPAKATDFDECLSWIRERDYLLNRKVKIKQSNESTPESGIGCGIGEEGELLVRKENGKVEKVFSAERLLVC